MDNFSHIGFFQFDNLVRNRVPFLFINFDTNIQTWYSGVESVHLKTWSIFCNPDQVETEIQERQIPNHFAIVFLCKDGKLSEKAALDFQNKGFNNVYFFKDGLIGLEKEKATV